MIDKDQIPVVDLEDLRSEDPAALDRATSALRVAFGHFGLVYIRNHGIAMADIDGFYDAFKAFTKRDEAYKRTPKGVLQAKAEAASSVARTERRLREEQVARQEKKRQELENTLKENLQYIAETQRKVQQCINWQGQIPSLVRLTKDALHNPRSFEHVRTEMKLVGNNPETSLPGVVMEYRAENAFGAIRTESVSAFIVPDDCSVRAIKEHEPSDFQ